MRARLYKPSDAAGLDKLIPHPTKCQPGLDDIYVVGDVGVPRGVLVCRPSVFIHELEVGSDLLAGTRADALANFAIGRRSPVTAVFLIRGANERMRRWAEKFGAVAETEPGDIVYTLTV